MSHDPMAVVAVTLPFGLLLASCLTIPRRRHHETAIHIVLMFLMKEYNKVP